jgi:sporulation protein YlmC with PRC-barrel domain
MSKQATVATTASVLTLATVFGAAAQTRPSTESPSRAEISSKVQRQAWAPQSGAMEASKLIGTKVKNDAGKDMGEIDQLIVDSSSGKVSQVVVDCGGVAGVGEQKVVLDWSDVKLQADPKNRSRMVATVDQAKLDSAPRYEARRDRPRRAPGRPGRPDRTRNKQPTERRDDAHAESVGIVASRLGAQQRDGPSDLGSDTEGHRSRRSCTAI